MPNLKSRLRGCLIGQCLGDALGYPIEGHDEAVCNDFVFNHVRSWFTGDGPSDSSWSGQYTDDSQMARELLISLIECGGLDPNDYVQRLIPLFSSGNIVGRGIACDEALNRLRAGVAWDKAGCPPPRAGNGTAMRAAPVGMYYYRDLEVMIEISHRQGYITHQDTRCSAGSVAIAGTVALILREEADDVSKLIETLADWMARHDDGFAELMRKLPDWLELPPHRAVEVIGPAGRAPGHIEDWPGISPFVVPSVLWSLYAFLRGRDDYFEAISIALSIGGDVDTTAAMTGALSGAWLGLEALPIHLARRVNDHGDWGFDELVALAERCPLTSHSH